MSWFSALFSTCEFPGDQHPSLLGADCAAPCAPIRTLDPCSLWILPLSLVQYIRASLPLVKLVGSSSIASRLARHGSYLRILLFGSYCSDNKTVFSLVKQVGSSSNANWLTGHRSYLMILLYESYSMDPTHGSYSMDPTLWILHYGSYSMDPTLWILLYDSYSVDPILGILPHDPTVWIILYGFYSIDTTLLIVHYGPYSMDFTPFVLVMYYHLQDKLDPQYHAS